MREPHPDPEEIAALGEDSLPAEEESRVRRHLDSCDSCAGIERDLRSVRRALGELPVPPLPPDVALRIDAALAAEEQHQQRVPRQATRPGVPVSRETAAPPGPPHRWPRLGLAAAGAVVALAVGSALLSSAGTGDGGTTTGAVQDHAQTSHIPEGSEDELEGQVRELLAESEEAGATGPGLFSDGSGSPPESPAEESPEMTPPEENESRSSNSNEGDEAGDGGAASSAEPLQASLPLCVRAAIDRHEAPLAAAEDYFAGRTAYLVVLPHAADPNRVDAYVVDADCVRTSPSSSGEVLIRESYPR
ncbi:hypothetical protein [Streptomyces sp. 7-21]|uniref:hypothetical protein n=1 Tax=Streptomyces sp. 7-21 TaxID=2802283 RepID=UPI00191DC706|nr:hypothetical protein [Streptomyces sp. 7-21]MBL1066129.1 hypothetical protein [Streptomyces sp. 7-21]